MDYAISILNKTCSVKFRAVFDTKLQVLFVLFGKEGHVQFYVRSKQTLAVGKCSAVFRIGVDGGAFDGCDGKNKQAVVQKQFSANGNIFVQIFVGNANLGVVANNVFANKVEVLSFNNFHRAIFKSANAHFGALGVNHDGDGHTKTTSNLFYCVNLCLMLGVSAVAHVDARNVHSGKRHFFDLIVGTACRTKCTNYFGFSHTKPPK